MLLFIFDMDEVLYGYDWQRRMAGMTELTGLSLEQLRERWWHEEGEMAAEAGGFADAEIYLAAFNDAIGVEVSEADWVRIRGGAMEPWRDSIAARSAGASVKWWAVIPMLSAPSMFSRISSAKNASLASIPYRASTAWKTSGSGLRAP